MRSGRYTGSAGLRSYICHVVAWTTRGPTTKSTSGCARPTESCSPAAGCPTRLCAIAAVASGVAGEAMWTLRINAAAAERADLASHPDYPIAATDDAALQ